MNIQGRITARIVVLLILWILAGTRAFAEQPLVLLSNGSNSYLEVSSGLQRHQFNDFELKILNDQLTEDITHRNVIAVGSRACEQSLAKAGPQTRILCSFLPSANFETLRATLKGDTLYKDARFSAVFIDQPLERQMRLALLIKPDTKSIGTVLGKDNIKLANEFKRACTLLNLVPVIAHLEPEDNPVQILGPAIEKSDVFLPLPDRSVFNQAAAKWILYLSLRNGVPLIGFSQKYADAGAVAALYTNVDQIAAQTATIALQMLRSATLPAPTYPNQFEISINHTAARNLGLQLNANVEATLKQQLIHSEGRL